MGEEMVRHRRMELDGYEIFYREAGAENAPAVLLPHGYPCSSYEFRNLMPLLADRWRLVAPDFPGCGYSDTPRDFCYDFDGYAEFLVRFADRMGLHRFVLYLHDFGSQIGLRLAIHQPQRIAGLIIQNGDIYEDQLGPKYRPLKDYFDNPTAEGRQKLLGGVNAEEFRHEFLNEVGPELAERIAPDLWSLHSALMTPRRRQIMADIIAGLRGNLDWFPRYQAYLRKHQPPTLIVWGPNDGYMPEGAARAYLRDVPDAELHLLDGGHWLLETHLVEAANLMRSFLAKVHAGTA
jgi:pimeloyl-ACP methyl ester carboxylesterase